MSECQCCQYKERRWWAEPTLKFHKLVEKLTESLLICSKLDELNITLVLFLFLLVIFLEFFFDWFVWAKQLKQKALTSLCLKPQFQRRKQKNKFDFLDSRYCPNRAEISGSKPNRQISSYFGHMQYMMRPSKDLAFIYDSFSLFLFEDLVISSTFLSFLSQNKLRLLDYVC